jgi:Gluconate 2-dehydrogenase subunit 3
MEEPMTEIARRVFMQRAAAGTLAFMVGGVEVMLTPRQARAQAVPLRTLSAELAQTLEAMGEALVPGAKQAGIVHFVDQQLTIPPQEALLQARILNVAVPFANFYRAAIGAIDRASTAKHGGRRFAQLNPTEQHDFIDLMRQNKIEGWQGPGGSFVYLVLRSDAVDVVYGTVDGYARLGVPYQAHIEPEKRW